MKIYLARPRGFCAGVDRAIDIVKLALDTYLPPVYVRHEIVHNHHVVNDLKKRGAVFCDDIENIPPGSVTIFSAHGVAPAVRKRAAERGLRIIDATCPLVTKVHLEALKYAKEGKHIILIGHRNHVEVEGTIGEAPESMTLVETLEDIDKVTVPDPNKVAVLTQTTLSIDDAKKMTEALRKRFPSISGPRADDICYATTNRQAAVRKMAKYCQLILVIGSPTSSNSNRLVEVAESKGVRSQLVDDASQITAEMLTGIDSLGITAGASAPEFVVQNVLTWLHKHYDTEIHNVEVSTEEVRFSVPKSIMNTDSSAAK